MSDILLPVYLNQLVVFDMVAMLNDGLATIATIETRSTDSESRRSQVSGRFGLGEALASLFTVGVEASGESGREQTGQDIRTEQRVHTPSSLLKRLRDDLEKRNELKGLRRDSVQPGDLIEFSCELKRNPVIRAFSQMAQTLETARLFSGSGAEQKPAPGGGKKKSRSTRPTPEAVEMERLENQISQFIEMLRAGGSIDLIAEGLPEEMRAVLTVDEAYLNDRSMADLVDGRFRVLGKVIRVVEDSSDGISLLRKTSFAAMTRQKTSTILGAFEEALDEDTFDMPTLEWFIDGPVVHVLPVGIYA